METTELYELFQQALDSNEKPLIALRQTIVDLRAQNMAKETLLNALQNFRQSTKNETDEDTVLEVMDFLVGFCSSHMRID